MPIDETISGSGMSAEANPTALASDVVIGQGLGDVFLETQSPASDLWVVVAKNKRGSFAVATPDPALTYRIRTTNESQDVPVYFGP